jgi:hypothetical protein
MEISWASQCSQKHVTYLQQRFWSYPCVLYWYIKMVYTYILTGHMELSFSEAAGDLAGQYILHLLWIQRFFSEFTRTRNILIWKFSRAPRQGDIWGVEVWLHMEMMSFTPWPLYSRRTNPRHPLVGGWAVPRASLDTAMKRNIMPPPGIETHILRPPTWALIISLYLTKQNRCLFVCYFSWHFEKSSACRCPLTSSSASPYVRLTFLHFKWNFLFHFVGLTFRFAELPVR